MGMAYQGPENGNRTKLYISEHAMDRLRQRSKAIVHLREFDLMHMIDAVVDAAIKHGNSEDIIDKEGEDALLVDMTQHLNQTLMAGVVFALVKPNRKGEHRDAVVTILDERAAQRIRRREATFKQVEKEPFNPVFQELANMKVEPKEIKSDVVSDPKPDPPKVEEQQYLLLNSEGSFWTGTKAQMLERLPQVAPPVRLFKECKLKIKVEVEE